MNEVRTAVIGVGHQGRWHAEKFAALPESQLVGVIDLDEARCAALADELGIAAIRDYRDLPGKVDAVCIASPTSSHFDIASMLLGNGIHVLIEKPITSTLDEARKIVAQAAENCLVLQVGHLERFNPAILALGEILEEPLFVESTRIAPFSQRSVDVSVVLDLMIHDIDLIHAVVRSPIVNMDASGGAVITDDVDIANARIRFENGCVANVTASRAGFKVERKLRLFQRNAYFSLDLHKKVSRIYRKTGDSPTISQDNISVDEQTYGEADAMLTQNQAFLASVMGGEPPAVSGEVGMQALETALAIGEMVRSS